MIHTSTGLTHANNALEAFVAAWLAPNVTERRRQIDRCWSDDGDFVAPNANSHGRAGIVDTMAVSTSSWPTNARIVTSEIAEHHGWFRYTWNVVAEDGHIHGAGLHVAQLDDNGRLRRVVAFYGTTPQPT